MGPLAPRLGQTRNEYQMRSLHSDRMKKEPPVKREPAQDDDEDVTRPPDDLTEEESTKSDSEFGDEPCPKRRKASLSNDYDQMDRNPVRLPSEHLGTRGRLSNEPSNISASVFTTSQKDDDDELGESFSQPSQLRRKKPLTYSNNSIQNIHTEDPKPKGKKKTQNSPVKATQNTRGFKIRGIPSVLSKGMHSSVLSSMWETTKAVQCPVAKVKEKKN